LMLSSKDKKFKAVIWILNTEVLYYTETLVSIYKTSIYSKTCLNRTLYIPETWTNGK
jgi:hypothetical protein